MVTLPGIPEFYSGRHILITGATGFMGKVLIEKLLRSCPDVGNIYILVRSRKGKTSQGRWNELTDLHLFNLLKEERPNALSTRVTVLDGDISNELLGLKKEDYKLLEENISIIFHVAASVRFNDPLHEAVRLNTFGTLQIVTLALKLKNLKALVHVSTAYSNCDRSEVEEKIYPFQFNWREVMQVAEKIDPIALSTLTSKFLGKLPNTYILTKRLAENLVWEFKDEIPIIIFRPSIVISAWKEPIAGWLDNFNGPVGMMTGISKGVIRTVPTTSTTIPDLIPVDVAIKAMIVSAWKRGTSFKCGDKELIYNCASTYKNITNGDLHKMGLELHELEPVSESYIYPRVTQPSNLTLFRIEAIYKHFLPALFVDTLLRFTKMKPMLLKIQIKIQTSLLALSYFMFSEWKFRNENFLNLNNDIPIKDKILFDYNFSDLVPREYFYSAMKGGKKFLLKEKDNCVTEARRRFKIIKYAYYTALTSFRLGILWILFKIYSSYYLVEY